MATLRQSTNVALGCGAAPRLVKARDSPATRVRMAGLESGVAALHLKEKNTVEKPKRRSVVSKAVSVEAEKELELNIADDVTQVPDCEIDAVLYTISGVWVCVLLHVNFVV